LAHPAHERRNQCTVKTVGVPDWAITVDVEAALIVWPGSSVIVDPV
jgi:hypothetical protein